MSNELKPVYLVDHLNFDAYGIKTDDLDPGKEDVSYVLYVAGMLPRFPSDLPKVDPRILASLLLAAHQDATEKWSKAKLWAKVRKIDTDAALAMAIEEVGGTATTAEKRAKKETGYVDASKAEAIGEAYLAFYDKVLKNFETSHYWARDEEASRQKERKMLNYEVHSDFNVGGGESKTDSEGSDFKF